jgi:hypothetical protein
MGDAVYQRAIELLEADLNDELVALDPQQGNCYGFNSVATTVWRQLEVPRSLAELKAHLLAEYDIDESTCEAELCKLLEELQARGLICHSVRLY